MTAPFGARVQQSVPERWWIVAPFGHRAYYADRVPETVEFLGQQVPVINAGAPDLDDWVCDWCSEPIELEREGRTLLVPMFQSSALCRGCHDVVCRDEGIRLWSDAFCGCPPCSNALRLMEAVLNR